MDFDQAIAITAPNGLARARLERRLDAADEAHREVVSKRLAVSRYCPEMDADMSELQALADVLSRAGHLAALHLGRLRENNLSVPDDVSATAHDLTERLEEALDGLLLPTAARVLAAACALEASSLPPA